MPAEAWIDEDGQVLSVVAFADENMIETPAEEAFYVIADRGDDDLEAIEIISRPSLN